MTNARLAEKMKRCVGCTNDFYNDKNPLGIKECWDLKTARIVKRVRVPLSQRPPWTQAPVKVYQCRNERGNVLMSIESCNANNRACEEATRRMGGAS